MSPQTYRKLQVHTLSSDFRAATKLVEVPLTDPAPNQVRIKNIYSGVNAADSVIASGKFVARTPPFDTGNEAIGIIDALGTSVPEGYFDISQVVLVTKGTDLFSEYLYKDYVDLIPLPNLRPDYLGAFLTGLTASIGLDIAGRIKPGEKVLITAAAGGTGQIAVQWAKLKGAYVIGLTSSQEKANYLKEIGADYVINWKEQNLNQVLTEQFPKGIDVIWETVGGETYRILYNHLARKGRLILIGSIHSYQDSTEEWIADVPIKNFNLQTLLGAKTVTGFGLNDYLAEHQQEYLSKLIGLIAQRKIIARVDLGERSVDGKFFGLENVYKAEEWLHKGRNIGKVVIQVQNP